MSATKVKLTSPYRQLKVTLEPPVEERSERFGLRIVEPAKQIKFQNGMAEIPAEWLELLKTKSCYTGLGGPKSVYLMDEMRAGQTGGVQVTSGAISSGNRVAVDPPLPNWDQLTGSEIIKALEAGQIQDPAAALAFEASRRKRGPVLVALTKAVAGVDDEEPKRTRAAGTAQSRRVPEGQEAI